MSDRTQTPLSDITIPARAPYSVTLEPGDILRLIDLEGQQALDALFYNADDMTERYCAHTTLAHQAKAGGSAYLGSGSRLFSNESRVLLTVIADTSGLHDTSAGACSCEANTVRFGHHTRFMHACRENFLLELGKYGMGKRDLVSNVNFFMNVPISPDGELAIADGVSAPGAYVELRAETRVLCLFSNCPQVNNPCNGFNPTPVRAIRWAG
ncbi:urea amidolyase associated protein UAAP2 [Acidisoma sp. 7E03]